MCKFCLCLPTQSYSTTGYSLSKRRKQEGKKMNETFSMRGNCARIIRRATKVSLKLRLSSALQFPRIKRTIKLFFFRTQNEIKFQLHKSRGNRNEPSERDWSVESSRGTESRRRFLLVDELVEEVPSMSIAATTWLFSTQSCWEASVFTILIRFFSNFPENWTD